MAGSERRIMCRALTLWEVLRGGDGLPCGDRFGAAIEPDLAPHVYAVRLGDSLAEARFERCGEVLAGICGCPPGGVPALAAVPLALREPMLDFFHSVVRYRQPMADSGAMLLRGREILYRNVVMPVAGSDRAIDRLYGAFSYKEIG